MNGLIESDNYEEVVRTLFSPKPLCNPRCNVIGNEVSEAINEAIDQSTVDSMENLNEDHQRQRIE